MNTPEVARQRTCPRSSSAWSDTRGAVMVVGVFMCACMVGALWYLAGIGDAIIYRERLQEAADATAFSAAVLHARGMNMLVLINLTMACILGVRVTLKAVQVALGIAAVFCALIPPLWEFEPICLEGVKLTEDVIRATRTPINRTLEALSSSQKIMARLVPAAAAAGSLQVGAKYQPMVQLAGAADPAGLAGLPVVEDSPDHLCGEAGKSVVGLFGMAIPAGLRNAGAQQVLDKLQSVIGRVVASGGAYFCELGSGSAEAPSFDDEYDAVAKDGCARQKQASGTASDPGARKLDREQCSKAARARTVPQKAAPPSAALGSGKGMTPKKVAPSWQNGVSAAQLDAVSVGNGASLAVAPVGVRIGAWSGAPAVSRSPLGERGFAQAEFFFDCDGRWASSACNGPGESALAMWNFRWRARLRRWDRGLSELVTLEAYTEASRAWSAAGLPLNLKLANQLREAATEGVIH